MLDQVKTYKNVHKKIARLQSELKRMQCFLKDADERQDDDERVRNWICDVRDVAYDADDLIDTFLLRVELRKRQGTLRRTLTSLTAWNLRLAVKRELDSLKIRIKDVSTSRETYGIREFRKETSRVNERLRQLRRSSPRGQERDIVGLHKDTDTLVQLISKGNQWRAVSIVGMGGIGKTTLAKRIYNHEELRGHFSCRAWVYVSQEFKPREILQEILKQVNKSERNLESLSEARLEDMLHEYLVRKRYLVVLDDIWSSEAWVYLEKAFPKNSRSRLIITTRNKAVALHADARTAPHELQFLNKEDSWELLCRKAFIEDINRTCPPELEETGKAIVGKCGGLPLAIVVLGGLLSRKRNLNEWERVLNNIRTHFARDRNGVAEILALSYKDLPGYLRSCFLYMGLFPEDHLISTRRLIRLWIAEGFIQTSPWETMEDVAEDYLNELIDRNMVQVAKVSVNERVKKCHLHDLLRELSISRAKAENFLEIHGNLNSLPSPRSRRHSVYSKFNWYASLEHSTQHLRSLHFFGVDEQDRLSQLDFVCCCFQLLRVLDFEEVKVFSVPKAIGELVHLKYLGLRHTKIYELPSTLGSLFCLETLDVAASWDLKIIPNIIWKLRNLRHLYMCGHRDTGKLKVDTLLHLQTLKDIRTSNWVNNDPRKLRSLRKLGIRGSFALHKREIFHSFSYLGHLRSLFLHTEDVIFPSLRGLACLTMLTKLHLKGGVKDLPMPDEFPPNLCQLTLQFSHLDHDPMEVLGRLPKLLILRLRAFSFNGNKLSISANGFPQIKVLEFESLEYLEELRIEEGAMPRLQCLRIANCRKVGALPEELKSITTLQELEIKEMRDTFINRIRGVDFYKVQHIPTIRFS